MNSRKSLFLGVILLAQLLAGCTSAMDSTTDPRASLIATPNEIQQGEEVTFDGREF